MKSSPCPSLLVSILFCYDFPGILFTFNHSSVFFSSILSVFFCGPIRNVGNVSKTALLLFFFFWLWEYSIRLLKWSFYSRSSWTFFRDYCIEFWIWGLVVGSIKILPSCLYALWKAFFVPRLMCHQYLFLVDPVFYLSVDVFFFLSFPPLPLVGEMGAAMCFSYPRPSWFMSINVKMSTFRMAVTSLTLEELEKWSIVYFYF